MPEVIDYRFRLRRALAATWTSTNDVLLDGEFGLERDTKRLKIGDGTTAWNALPYFEGSTLESVVHAAASKTTPVNNDELALTDSASSYGLKKLRWSDLKATLKAYFDTLYSGGGGGGSGPYTYSDPVFSSVSSLLHFEGSNGSTTITDQVSGNVWTANGGAAISTAWFAKGASSLLVGAASNSCISMPTSSKYDVGAGDWTIQFTYKYVGVPATSARIFQTADGDIYAGISLNMNDGSGSQVLKLYMSSDNSSFNIANGIVLGTLPTSLACEVLVERRGGTIYCFFDGFLSTSTALSSATLTAYYNSANTVIIGGNKTGTSRSINAYLDEFRFTKGSAILVPNRAYPVQPAFPDS